MAPRPKTPAVAPLFPEAPEDLSALTDEQLAEMAAEFQTAARAIASNDADVIGDTPGEDVIAQMTAGVTELERVRAEIGARAEAEATYTSTVGDLAAQFGIDDEAPEAEASADEDPEAELAAADEDPEDEADEADEPEAEASAVVDEPEEAVVASVRLRRPPAAPSTHQPRISVNERDAAPVLAAAGFEGILRPGQRLDRDLLVKALGEAQRIVGRPTSGKDKVVIASAQFDFPEERRLSFDDFNANDAKIKAVTSPEAVLASGGFCAPYPVRYDLPFIATDDTPVENALPTFNAERGGIRYPTPIGLAAVVDGITVVTAAQDEAGGSSAIKNCVVIDCDPFQEAEVEAIAACVQHGNLNARAWPERVNNVTDLLGAAQSQASEGQLLAAMTAGSTVVTDPGVYGAYLTLITATLKAAVQYRSSHRMQPNVRLRAMFPAWVRELIVADQLANPYKYENATIEGVEALLSRAGVNVSWFIDEDGTTQSVYDAITDGGLQDFFTTVGWYLFHEGHWLVLDMGRLDLGIVRDSGLNSTNDFEIFSERFLGLAGVGYQSVKILSQVCPSGAYPAGSTLTGVVVPACVAD